MNTWQFKTQLRKIFISEAELWDERCWNKDLHFQMGISVVMQKKDHEV